MNTVKRICFAVLLIVALVMQEPPFSKAGTFENKVSLRNKQAYRYALQEEVIDQEDIDALDEFQLQYYLNGGELTEDYPVCYEREDLPIILETPVREGYNFAGWYTDSGYSNKLRMIDKDNIGSYKLYAKWTKCISGDYSIQMYSYQTETVSSTSSKKLKNCSYDFLENVEIPGMPSTKEDDVNANRITNTNQCPQGICIAKEYLLVSSYSSEKNNLGCIHVFDKITGEYLVTLGMSEKSHLGGITYDGCNIWVCHSNNNTLECIPYMFVDQIASCKPMSIVDCSQLFESYHVSNTPSCIAYYDGLIWIATHTKILNSTMTAYKITKNGLRQVASYRIPEKVQGITFDEAGLIYISTSYGRKNSSYLRIYDSLETLDQKPNQPKIKIEMPPCSEEIDMAEGQLFILFESAAEQYFEGTDGKGKCLSPIDKVLTLSKSSIFQ